MIPPQLLARIPRGEDNFRRWVRRISPGKKALEKGQRMRFSFRDLKVSELAEEVVIYPSLMTLRGRKPGIY
jgi:hypothetical protein